MSSVSYLIDHAGVHRWTGPHSFGSSGTPGGPSGLSVIHIDETFAPTAIVLPAALEFTVRAARPSNGNNLWGLSAQLCRVAIASEVVSAISTAGYESWLDSSATGGSIGTHNYFRAGGGSIGGTGAFTAIALYRATSPTGSGTTITTLVGVDIDTLSRGTTNIGFRCGANNNVLGTDNARQQLGSANDAYLVFNGSDLIVSAGEVTTTARTKIREGTVLNNAGIDSDSQIKGAGDDNLVYADAGLDAVGIGTATPTSKLTVAGDIEVLGDERGLILESPDGTRWRVQVDNSGVLGTTSL